MKFIGFGGIWCSPEQITKDGDFKIKGVLSKHPNHPEVARYEHFASTRERDIRYNQLMMQLENGF
jgi:hypothetical protein